MMKTMYFQHIPSTFSHHLLAHLPQFRIGVAWVVEIRIRMANQGKRVQIYYSSSQHHHLLQIQLPELECSRYPHHRKGIWPYPLL
jgi:hypothetical protein